MRAQSIPFFILFVFNFVSQTSFCQITENFEKGSYTDFSNQITEGFIKTEAFQVLTESICFKKQLTDKACEPLDTSKIKVFQTENGKYFELLTFKVDNGTKEITAFAHLIVEGETMLYKSFYNALEVYIVKNKNTEKTFVLQKDKFNSGDLEVTRNFFERNLNIATEGFAAIHYQNIIFREKQFVEIINAYNLSKGFTSKVLTYKEKKSRFVILTAGAGTYQNDNEFFIKAMQRTYYPKISRSTSLNVGLSYYQYIENNDFSFNSSNYKITTQLVSVPVQIQQNILNKGLRPYLFIGLNLSYITKKDALGRELIKKGIQNNYGIGYMYGGGVEVDITKRFFLKSEFRQESFQHALLFGISFFFER